MKLAYQKLKKLSKKLLGLLPSRLPVGMAEFEVWAKDISETYQMPTQHFDSIKFSLASILLGVSHKKAYQDVFVPKYYFALKLHSGAAKQIASGVLWQLKEEQKRKEAEAKAAAELAKTEATVPPVLSVVNPQA